MKVLLSLTAFCIILALCHGYCTYQKPRAEIVDGKLVPQDWCVDSSDRTKHPIGAVWDSANCLRCSCGRSGMSCCSRYGGIGHVPGCTAVLDPESCKYKYHEEGDPTKPCNRTA